MGSFTLYADSIGQVYIAKIDSGTGNVLWVKTSAGISSYAHSIAVNKASGAVVVSGNFQSSQSFDALSQSFVPYNFVNRNFFLLKITNPVNCPADTLVTPLGVSYVAAENNGDAVVVYPNPAREYLKIDGTGSGCEIKLFNILGQQLYRAIANGAEVFINTSNFNTGTYLLQLTDSDGYRLTRKVVKE